MQLPTEAAAILWATELALAVAHQGMGPDTSEALVQVQNELLISALPVVISTFRAPAMQAGGYTEPQWW